MYRRCYYVLDPGRFIPYFHFILVRNYRGWILVVDGDDEHDSDYDDKLRLMWISDVDTK